jgi:DNA-binding response OmpR family regulator
MQESAERCTSVRDPDSKGTILIAEDGAAIRRFVTGVLEEQGYSVLAASDGAEALGLAESYAGDIHVLLTDFDMPRLNGAELTEAMRRLFPSVGVIVMSGDLKRETSVHISGVSFLGKPFAASALLEKVRAVLG